MPNPFTIKDREPTLFESAVGRGECSGRDGLWRVFDVLTHEPLAVYFTDSFHIISNAEEWRATPRIGLQVIVAHGGVWWCCDEYRYHGQDPKLGIYLDDYEFDRIMAEARERSREQARLIRGH